MTDRLDKRRILAACELLDRRLARRHVIATVHVVGGAAMALAWDERRTTRDVDAVFETDGHGAFIEEIHAVAKELDLPRSWLNEQATMYAPADYRSNEGTVFSGTNLRVAAASPEAVLSMKVRAGREGDVTDIRFLLDKLGLNTVEAVLTIHDRWFPGDPLPDRKRLRLEDIVDSL